MNLFFELPGKSTVTVMYDVDVHAREVHHLQSCATRVWRETDSMVTYIKHYYGTRNITVDMKEFMLVKLRSITR